MFDSQLGKEFLHTFKHYLLSGMTTEPHCQLDDFEYRLTDEGYRYREKVWTEWKTFQPTNVEIVNLAEKE